MSRRKDLAKVEAGELGPARNAVGDQVAAIVNDLPPGIYRSQMTVCLITVDANGIEKSSRVVGSHCFDFKATPKGLAAADPPKPPTPELTCGVPTCDRPRAADRPFCRECGTCTKCGGDCLPHKSGLCWGCWQQTNQFPSADLEGQP